MWVGWRCRKVRVSVGGVEVQEGKGECGWGRGGVGWRCRRVRVCVGGMEVQEDKGGCGWGGGAVG